MDSVNKTRYFPFFYLFIDKTCFDFSALAIYGAKLHIQKVFCFYFKAPIIAVEYLLTLRFMLLQQTEHFPLKLII